MRAKRKTPKAPQRPTATAPASAATSRLASILKGWRQRDELEESERERWWSAWETDQLEKITAPPEPALFPLLCAIIGPRNNPRKAARNALAYHNECMQELASAREEKQYLLEKYGLTPAKHLRKGRRMCFEFAPDRDTDLLRDVTGWKLAKTVKKNLREYFQFRFPDCPSAYDSYMLNRQAAGDQKEKRYYIECKHVFDILEWKKELKKEQKRKAWETRRKKRG